MCMRTIVTTLTLVVLLASLALSQYSARESFEYPIGDSLVSMGKAANGFAGPWTRYVSAGWGNYSETYTDTTASIETGLTPLAYNDLIYPISNLGSWASVSTPGGWGATAVDQRLLDKTWPNTKGQIYWISFVFDQGPVPTSGVYDLSTFYTVKLLYNTNELLAIGKQGGANVYSCGSGWSGNPDDASLTEMTTDPVWLVTKIVMSGDTNSRTYMWINPDPNGGEPDTNVADVKRWSGMINGFNTVTVSNGGNDKITTNYDEIRLGTDWNSVSAPVVVTGVSKQITSLQPGKFDLGQNYPNPFNPTTRMNYSVNHTGYISLKVYNVLGQHVATLFEGVKQAGTYEATFNATRLSSGIYFVRLQNATNAVVKKMMLVK